MGIEPEIKPQPKITDKPMTARAAEVRTPPPPPSPPPKQPSAIVRLWRKVTPWKEEKGETLGGEIAERWRAMTPWAEEKGETFGGVVASVLGTVKEAPSRAWQALEPPTTPPEAIPRPQPINLSSGARVEFDGDPVEVTQDDRARITRDIQAQYPELKQGDVVTITYTKPKEKPLTGELSVEILGKKFTMAVSPIIESPLRGMADYIRVNPSELTGELWGGIPISPKVETRILEFDRTMNVLISIPEIKAELKKEPLKWAKELSLSLAQTFVPGVNLATRWDEMSRTEKLINIAIDATIFAVLLRGAVRMGMRLTTGGRQKAIINQFMKQEIKLTKQTTDMLRKSYGKDVASKFKTMGEAQRRYFESLIKLDKLKSATRPAPPKIKMTQEMAEKLARQLEAKAKSYVDSLKAATSKAYKTTAKFDDPAVARLMDDLPREIVRNTQSVVEGLKPSKVNIKALEREVVTAEVRLKEFQTKFPTTPSKWSDLMYELAIKQSKLLQAKGGNILVIQSNLIKMRESLSKARGARRNKIQASIYELEDKLRNAIKGMEIEWGRGGAMSSGNRGGIAIADPRVRPRIGAGGGVGVKLSPVVPKVIIMPHIIPLATHYDLGESEFVTIVTKATPDEVIREAIEEAMVGETTPDVIKEAQRIIGEAVREATHFKVAGMTDAEIKASIEALVKGMIGEETAAQVRPALEARVKALSKVAIKLGTKIGTRLKTSIKWKPFIIWIPDASTGKKRPMTSKELAGAVAWKQGFIYKVIFPPYGEKDIINTREPIKGVKIVMGIRSAYLSIARLGGKIPPILERDMGIMDIHITTKRRARPRIRFKRDVKQRTTLTPITPTLKSLRGLK